MPKLDSEQTEKSDKDRYETSEDEETEDNNNNAIFSSKSMCIEGTAPTDKIPIDNKLALY